MNSNNVDFIAKPDNSFLYSSDKLSDHYEQLKVIESLCSPSEDLDNFIDSISGLVVLAYFRLNEKHQHLNLDIPTEASLATLKYTPDSHICMDIFERFKIICNSNNVLERTARIFEPYLTDLPRLDNYGFIKGYADYVEHILGLNWSDGAFNKVIDEKYGNSPDRTIKKRVFSCTDQVIGLYVEGELMYDVLHNNLYTEGNPLNLQSAWDGLDRLINPSPQKKQLCLSTRFMEYVFNFLEKTGWPQRNRWQAVRSGLANVQTIQNNDLLWAMHTVELALCGCKEVLTGEIEIPQTLDKITDRDFDVINLPGISNETVSDYGPIDLGPVKVESCNALYYVAYLFTLLNSTGRMLVMVENDDVEFYSGKNLDYYIKGSNSVTGENVIKYLTDNDFIEAVFQTGEINSYILINKLKPEHKRKKVMFYYNKNMYDSIYSETKECFETFSWDMSNIKSNVGAYVGSILEIQRNDYRLLAKEYIYDFDRITANAEFRVVSHLAHDLSPKLATVDSVLKHLIHFVESHGLMKEPFQVKYYEGQTLEPVGEAIANARSDISQMHRLIKDTRKVITEEISLEDFSSVNLRNFLETLKRKYANGNITLHINCEQDIQYEMHETSFAEMIDNFVRNAEIHGFVNGRKRAECKIVIKATQEKNEQNLTIEIKNNGNHLPDELTVDKFIGFGNRGKSSPGDGLGGAYIYKVIRAHRGSLEIIRGDKEFPVNFKITLPNPEGNK